MIIPIVPQAIGSLAAFERIQDISCNNPDSTRDWYWGQSRTTPSAPCQLFASRTWSLREGPQCPRFSIKPSSPIDKGSVVICSGPIGSGKTMLIKSILSEVCHTSGEISVSSKSIAYCEQSPWLLSATLKEAICGFSPKDPVFYEEVIRLCCLMWIFCHSLTEKIA